MCRPRFTCNSLHETKSRSDPPTHFSPCKQSLLATGRCPFGCSEPSNAAHLLGGWLNSTARIAGGNTMSCAYSLIFCAAMWTPLVAKNRSYP